MSSRSSSSSSEDRKPASYRSSSSRSRSRSPKYSTKSKKQHHNRRRKHERDRNEEDDYRSRKRDSDVENRHQRHHKRRHHSPARIKDEPDSDNERIRVKRERSEEGGRVRVKRERSEDGGRVRVKREHSDDRRSRQRHEMHQQRHERRQNDRHREERRQRSPFPSGDPVVEEEAPAEKDKPNFGLSGKLTEETNTFRGVVIKYSEPPEARKPRKRWRFYPFKGEQALPVLHISRQSAYLLGRDRKIADMPIDHPSCSKQHAALQYRLVEYERPDGTMGRQVRPYIIDLESANGTYVNNKRIDPRRYVELQEKDVVKFGFSTREYVLLHDKTSTEELGSDEGSGSEVDN